MALGRIKPVEMPDVPEGGGTITGLTWQRRDTSRCNVSLDGAFAFGVHANIVADAGLHKGMQLTEADCRRILKEDLFHRLTKRILQFVGYRPRSRNEVEVRLRQLGSDEAMSSRIVDQLTSWNLLDDDAFASQFAASRLRRHGPRRVRMDLIQKGIDAATAERILTGLVAPEDQDRKLDRLVADALHRYRREDDTRLRTQKVLRYLMRRGYEPEAVRRALERASRL